MDEVWVISASPLRESVADRLEREGYRVAMLDRATRVLELAAAGRPAALVTADSLPDASSFELAAALKEIPGFGQTPILVYVQDQAQPKLAFRERALRAGCFPLDRFPPDADEVVTLLGYALAELPAEGHRIVLRPTEDAPGVACVAADILDDRALLVLLENPLESFRNTFRPHSSLRCSYASAAGVLYEWIARIRDLARDWAQIEVIELASRRRAAS
ncbi:MAG: hypothetical protein FJZ01_18810 [Candidatus Sericytochromatia bacterium]|nr:hypothetical protein [Candidatus Tanganyikabacteria bacterium]